MAHFGSIQHIRWVASQRRALKALISNYVVTCSHFEDIVAENSTKAFGAKVKRLLAILKSPKFLIFLHFMMDLTEVIGSLSEAFQADNLMVIDVIPRVESAMLALEEMKSSPGRSVSSLVSGSEYKGVTLSGKVTPELGKAHIRLVTSAIDHMDSRFGVLQNLPLSAFTVLNYKQWPYDRKELVSYGMDEIKCLVQHFTPMLSEEDVDAVPREWLDFKLHVIKLRSSEPKSVYKDFLMAPPHHIRHLMPLVQIMMTLSMSTAIVERGFSHMNIVKNSTRTLLNNNTLNDLMELKINGPTLTNFTPDKAIIHWMNKGKGSRHLNGHRH